MTQAPQSQVVGKSPQGVISKSHNGAGLSTKKREDVAEKLLHDVTVSRVYAEDIVSCVVDMVPSLDAELRFYFVMKLYEFIFRCGHFDGRLSLKAFGGTFLTILKPEERSGFFAVLKSGLASDRVLACEANAWGLVHVAPMLDAAAVRDALLSLSGAAVRSALGSRARDVTARFVMNLDGALRLEAVRILCGLMRHKEEGALSDLIDVLTAVMPALPDEGRVFVADAMAPLIFDTDARIVRKALGYFTAAVRLLPVSHRLPFALMLTGLLQDIALSEDVVEALKRIEPSLASPEERARIEFALGFADGREGCAGGLANFAAPYMSPD